VAVETAAKKPRVVLGFQIALSQLSFESAWEEKDESWTRLDAI
jgi:hypothetical protein